MEHMQTKLHHFDLLCFSPYFFFPISSGAVRKIGRHQASAPQIRVARTITLKDVIAALEREPQMSKSTLIYRLYERIRSDASTE